MATKKIYNNKFPKIAIKRKKNRQTLDTTKLKRKKPFEGIGFNVEVHLQALCVQSF
jgi:hypothetical protein